MGKTVRLTESDLNRIVRRVIKEQINLEKENLPSNIIAQEVDNEMENFKSKMESFLNDLQSDESIGSIDKKRFINQVRNGTNRIYQEFVDKMEGPNDPRMNSLDRTFAHKQQDLYGYFYDLLDN